MISSTTAIHESEFKLSGTDYQQLKLELSKIWCLLKYHDIKVRFKLSKNRSSKRPSQVSLLAFEVAIRFPSNKREVLALSASASVFRSQYSSVQERNC